MGLFSSKKPKKPRYNLSEEGQKWQGRFTDQYEQAMSGNYMLPASLKSKMDAGWFSSLEQNSAEAASDMESYIDKYVDPRDNSQVNMLRTSIARQKATMRDNYNRANEFQRGQDEQWGINAAISELEGDSQVGEQMLGMYNKTAMWGADYAAQNGNGIQQGMNAFAPYLGMYLGSTQFGQGMSAGQTSAFNQGAGPVSKLGASNFSKYGQVNPPSQFGKMPTYGYENTIGNYNNLRMY